MSKAEQDADYRRALYGLVSKGYSIRRMARIIKEMVAEIGAEREERMAEYEMGRGPHP